MEQAEIQQFDGNSDVKCHMPLYRLYIFDKKNVIMIKMLSFLLKDHVKYANNAVICLKIHRFIMHYYFVLAEKLFSL